MMVGRSVEERPIVEVVTLRVLGIVEDSGGGRYGRESAISGGCCGYIFPSSARAIIVNLHQQSIFLNIIVSITHKK